MRPRRIEQLEERLAMLMSKAASICTRADAFERVARELRTEAASVISDVIEIRHALERDRALGTLRQTYAGRELARALRRTA